MPELPDLDILADALHASVCGRTVTRVEAPGPLTVRGTPAEMAALAGQAVVSVRRNGKFLVFSLARDSIVMNPMLTGRLQLAPSASTKRPSKTMFVMSFGPREGLPADAAPWTIGAGWMPSDAAAPEIRYRDPTQMGKVYIAPAGVERPIPGMGPDEMGPNADDPSLTLEVWRSRIRRHNGELKNVLRNQAFVAGIGNAYSDEILHAARLQPFRKRSTLAAEEMDELYESTGRTLANAITVLRERVPPTFETEVRDFLAVHNKGGQPCPRCGNRITQTEAGGFVTSYCRHCQR